MEAPVTNEQHLRSIAKLIRAGVDEAAVAQAILNALQETYHRGQDSIRKSADYQQREDMGR